MKKTSEEQNHKYQRDDAEPLALTTTNIKRAFSFFRATTKPTTRGYTRIDPKTKIPKKMVVINKSTLFWKYEKLFQKNRRETQLLALRKLLVFPSVHQAENA